MTHKVGKVEMKEGFQGVIILRSVCEICGAPLVGRTQDPYYVKQKIRRWENSHCKGWKSK